MTVTNIRPDSELLTLDDAALADRLGEIGVGSFERVRRGSHEKMLADPHLSRSPSLISLPSLVYKQTYCQNFLFIC